jgi:hypothetical protein
MAPSHGHASMQQTRWHSGQSAVVNMQSMAQKGCRVSCKQSRYVREQEENGASV